MQHIYYNGLLNDDLQSTPILLYRRVVTDVPSFFTFYFVQCAICVKYEKNHKWCEFCAWRCISILTDLINLRSCKKENIQIPIKSYTTAQLFQHVIRKATLIQVPPSIVLWNTIKATSFSFFFKWSMVHHFSLLCLFRVNEVDLEKDGVIREHRRN